MPGRQVNVVGGSSSGALCACLRLSIGQGSEGRGDNGGPARTGGLTAPVPVPSAALPPRQEPTQGQPERCHGSLSPDAKEGRDWNVLLGHAAATLAKFQVPEAEQRDVVAFVQSFKKEIVE